VAEKGNADESSDLLSFPEDKNPTVTRLETQLEELLKAAESSNAAESNKDSKSGSSF
jgi:hypothetical protein